MENIPDNAVYPQSRADWRAWLEENHARPNGVWVVFDKKGAGHPRVTYEEAVEEAVCFGWIDSKANRLDDERTLLWFSPRKAGAGWSKSNKERVERLSREGRMAPAGLEKVEAAKRDGSWNILEGIEALTVPPDLAAALSADPEAAKNFAAFPASARRMILYWIASAKRPETRAKRIQETVTRAAKNIRANL